MPKSNRSRSAQNRSNQNQNAALQQAIQYHAARSFQQAEVIYRQILAKQPKQVEVLNLLGVLSQQMGHPEAAVELLTQAIALKPEYPEAIYNLAVVLQEQGRLEEAIERYQAAVHLQPNYAAAHHNLGHLFALQNQLEAAILSYQQALHHSPNNPNQAKTCAALGTILLRQGRVAEAVPYYRRVVSLSPDNPKAHVDLASTLLLGGTFAEGFAEYEWRFQIPHVLTHTFDSPQWNGASLAGKTLLLQAEQGFGDVIQFVRYAPLLAAKAKRVILACQPPLVSLLQSMPGIEQVVEENQPLPDFDEHCALLSVPRILKTTVETIPGVTPYLFPSKTGISLEIPEATRLKVGIVWASGYANLPEFLQFYQKKTCSLALFMRLLEVPGVTLYSLQVGRDADEINAYKGEQRLQDLAFQLHDFAKTAAAIAQLDLVISIDTAVAHLAGAIAKPVWVLLPCIPNWRWFLDRDDSPWYPSMRLFRQNQPGDWEGVFDKVLEALKQLR